MQAYRAGFAILAIAACAASIHAQAPAPEQGKILSVNGRVEHTPAQQERWNAARVFQPLLTAERVRTLEASRASILFVDESQVKLNANAVLTVREVRGAGGAATRLDLSRGEGWFRTKNPRSGLTIQTPAAAAAVRGTEINLRVGANGETVLTVVEGSAQFSNPQGSILVNAGEEGTAVPGQAPTKRVILNPEDAVQWALYYPARMAYRDLPAAARAGAAANGFARLQAGDVAGATQAFDAGSDDWSRIGGSIAALARGDSDRARTLVAQPAAAPETEIERRAQLAAVLLATGDAAGAREEIQALLARSPTALRPLLLLSSIELRQNHPDLAGDAAARALAAHAESVGALIAASEAAQARFDLAAARALLDRALAIDDRDLHALINRARIRFGTGDTRGAREDADEAAAIAPDAAEVRSLRGFIALADGDRADARADFEAAARLDTEFGEPHLGLGLIHFREGQEDAGLLEMLTATLLEPKIALYQSYLGKAYYQAQRFPEGLAALDSAKRLDPRDPTPWLYASFYLRDQNRQVEALNELKRAIELNDFRAVYRSRMLLDRDLATKNVSLAEVYRQLGFEAWGAYEALNSLETDVANASAHLFLAETYGNLPDRTQAQGSELLQYFLYAPVNRNSFNNFAEYTGLLEQPRRQLSGIVEGGTQGYLFGDLVSRTGNERLATAAFIESFRRDGARPGVSDDRTQGFAQGKIALGRRSDLFFNFSAVDDERGESGTRTVVLGSETATPVIMQQFADPDPNRTNTIQDAQSTIGLKHEWRPGAVLTAVGRYDDLEHGTSRPNGQTSLCRGFDLAPFGAVSNGSIANTLQSNDLQIQQTLRTGRHQFVAGYQSWAVDKEDVCNERLSIGSEFLDLRDVTTGRDTATVAHIRDEIQLSNRVHATLGVDYQRLSYYDMNEERATEHEEVNPRAGLSVRVTPATVVRAAVFDHMNTNFLGDYIAPPTVAGFVISRNEFPTALRREADLAVEHSGRRAFVGVRGFYRETEVPFLLDDAINLVPEADATSAGGSVSVNWIATRRISVFADDQLIRLSAAAFDRDDNLLRGGINMIHPSSLSLRVTVSHVLQRFTNTVIPELPRSLFVLVDINAGYEFAAKRGLINFRMTNAFDRQFSAVTDNISTDPFLPERRAILSFRWRLY
jgi:tetratricopeptide (TPR) repeat protein